MNEVFMHAAFGEENCLCEMLFSDFDILGEKKASEPQKPFACFKEEDMKEKVVSHSVC